VGSVFGFFPVHAKTRTHRPDGEIERDRQMER
jgi:hypothetical protein